MPNYAYGLEKSWEPYVQWTFSMNEVPWISLLQCDSANWRTPHRPTRRHLSNLTVYREVYTDRSCWFWFADISTGLDADMVCPKLIPILLVYLQVVYGLFRNSYNISDPRQGKLVDNVEINFETMIELQTFLSLQYF